MEQPLNQKERQKFQMLKDGFRSVNNSLRGFAKKLKIELPEVKEEVISGVTPEHQMFQVTKQGFKTIAETLSKIEIRQPEDGHTPTDSELLALIKPLIPVIRQPEDGKPGDDGKTPTVKELLALIKPLIPVAKNGETPSDERLIALITPLIKEPKEVNVKKLADQASEQAVKETIKYIPKLGPEIRDSLEKLKNDDRLDKKAIRGLKEIEDRIDNIKPTTVIQRINGETVEETDPLSIHLDQTSPQTMTGLADGYLKLTAGVIGSGTIDLSGYVPYTGATTNVDLGQHKLTSKLLTVTGEIFAIDPVTTFTSTEVSGATFTSTKPSITAKLYSFITINGSNIYSTANTLKHTYTGGGNSILTISMLYGGTGFSIGDTVTLTGYGDGTAKIRIDNVSAGAVTAYTITNGGGGYSVGDFFNLNADDGSGSTFVFQVATVTASTTYNIDYSWDAVAGADGYKIIFNTQDAPLTFDRSITTTNTTLSYNETGTSSDVIATPTSPVTTGANITGDSIIDGYLTTTGIHGNSGNLKLDNINTGSITASDDIVATGELTVDGRITIKPTLSTAFGIIGTMDIGSGFHAISTEVKDAEFTQGCHVGPSSWVADTPNVTKLAMYDGKLFYSSASGQTIGNSVSWTIDQAFIDTNGYLNLPRLGAGVIGATARVHIAAGTATAGTAPIKLTSGTLTTVAVAGQIEFLTNDLYFTSTTSAVRRKIGGSGMQTPIWYPTADSTTALQINKANGTTNIITIDTTNSRMGIGTTAPSFQLHLSGLDSDGAAGFINDRFGGANGPVYLSRQARGTAASPTATQNGDNLLSFGSKGYGTSQFAAANTGLISFKAEANFTNTSNPTAITFSTTPTSSVTRAERMRITGAGGIAIATTSVDANNLVDIGGYGTPSNFAGGTGYSRLTIQDDINQISGVQMANVNNGVSADFRFAVFNNTKLNYIAFAMPSDSNNQNLFGLTRRNITGVFTNTLSGGTGRIFVLGTVDAKDVVFGTTNIERFRLKSDGAIEFADAVDFIFNATTGTKFGTATTQKLAFWNATPIVQPANTVKIDDVLINTGLMASGATNADFTKNVSTPKILTPEVKTDTTTPTDLTITTGAAKTLVLATPVYNDVYTQIAAAKIPAANFPDWATFTANTGAYTFKINDYADLGTMEVLHGYKEGTDLEVHLHLATNGVNDATARKVKYMVYYTWGNPDNGVNQFTAESSLTAELDIPANQADKSVYYLSLGTITGTNMKVGAQVKVRVKRIAGTGSEPINDPFLGMVGMHYQIDTMGSRTISAK